MSLIVCYHDKRRAVICCDAPGRGLYREILRAFIAATSEGALVNWTEKL